MHKTQSPNAKSEIYRGEYAGSALNSETRRRDSVVNPRRSSKQARRESFTMTSARWTACMIGALLILYFVTLIRNHGVFPTPSTRGSGSAANSSVTQITSVVEPGKHHQGEPEQSTGAWNLQPNSTVGLVTFYEEAKLPNHGRSKGGENQRSGMAMSPHGLVG